MARLFFNIWPLAPMEICPIPSKNCLSWLKIVPNDKWRFRKLPNTFKIWPKCQIFAKSGHTAASPLRIASQVVRLSQLRQQVGSRQLSTLGTPRSWPENTYRSESITVGLLVYSLTGFDQNILLIARSDTSPFSDHSRSWRTWKIGPG